MSREAFRKLALEHLRSEIWPLPRSPARWYFARFKLRVWWVDGRLARQPYRPTVIAVINMTNHYLLSIIPLKGADPATPTVEDGIGVLLRSMQSDYAGNRQTHNPKGSRPRKIGFGDSSLVQFIGPSLQEVGVGVVPQDPPPEALAAIRSFSALIRRTLQVDSPTHDTTGICAAPGVVPALLSRVFQKVSEFLQCNITALSPHTVFCIRLLGNNDLRFFTVLREGDRCAGLAMFSSLQDWARLHAADMLGLEGLAEHQSAALAVIAQHMDLIPFDDIEALETFGGDMAVNTSHRLPAFVEWRYGWCPAQMEDPAFRRALPICSPSGEDLSWFEVALDAVGDMLQKLQRGSAMPFSRTCTSVEAFQGKQKIFLSSFDSRTVAEQLMALHQHDLQHPHQYGAPLLEQHLSNRTFWPDLDARHGGLLKQANEDFTAQYMSRATSSMSSMGASGRSSTSAGSRNLYLEGQVTSLPNRAGSSILHPKNVEASILPEEPVVGTSSKSTGPNSKWLSRQLASLEATLEAIPVEHYDSEVQKLMESFETSERMSPSGDPLAASELSMPIGSPARSPGSSMASPSKKKTVVLRPSRTGSSSRGALSSLEATEKASGGAVEPSALQAQFRATREKEMKDNHLGGLSDFLDGIGGECYRAGQEHEIPINERLGLLGPMDKLGQNEHKQKIVVVEDQRCELWQGLCTVDYEKKWLPKLQRVPVLPGLTDTVVMEEEDEEDLTADIDETEM